MEKRLTPAEEVKKTDVLSEETMDNAEDVADNPAEPIVEPKDRTVEEILAEGEEKSSRVPLKTFLEVKKEKKELEREISELKEQVKGGATKAEISADLDSLANKYDVDPNFLKELSTVIYSKAKGDADAVLEQKLKPIQDKEKAEKINKIFNENFDKIMEELPEYSEVVNKDVIKELSLLPQNSKKTFQQIIEDTYGKSVSGKKTMETSTPRGGKDAGLDMNRINDPEYFKLVMETPELKKQYNEGIAHRIQL